MEGIQCFDKGDKSGAEGVRGSVRWACDRETFVRPFSTTEGRTASGAGGLLFNYVQFVSS